MFVKLPIPIYQPNPDLEKYGIEYDHEEIIRFINVNTRHISAYVGNDEFTDMWIVGSEDAWTVELSEKEFESKISQVVYVSATPSDYEITEAKNELVEQIVRPTGLIDPMIEVKKAKYHPRPQKGEDQQAILCLHNVV